MKDLSWAGKKSYQPNFELPNAKEPVKRSKPLEVSKRSIKGSNTDTWVKNKLHKNAKVFGFSESLSHLCSEVKDEPKLRHLTPAEIRAKRHAEKRYEARFKR